VSGIEAKAREYERLDYQTLIRADGERSRKNFCHFCGSICPDVLAKRQCLKNAVAASIQHYFVELHFCQTPALMDASDDTKAMMTDPLRKTLSIAVGQILNGPPRDADPPLPFRHYI
jgi:hypothetical protein